MTTDRSTTAHYANDGDSSPCPTPTFADQMSGNAMSALASIADINLFGAYAALCDVHIL
jgi:hypothetical protein